jgi:hypothetical integral membrane protein (TIGR02206 family)
MKLNCALGIGQILRGLVSVEPGRGAWDAFVPYGGLHLAAVSICALLVAGFVMTARALAAPQEAALRRAFGVSAVVYWIAYNIWWNRHELDPATGLPLHICDLNGLVAPLALLTGRRWLRATLYFWTFALTLQAFIQPTLTHGPASPVFWFFWAAHSIVVASAVYDLSVLGFRPQWRDLGRAYVVSALYAAVIVPVDLLLGANYGFIGNPPPGVGIPPFVDALGPWPLRAVIVVLLGAVTFALLVVPWQRSAARTRA